MGKQHTVIKFSSASDSESPFFEIKADTYRNGSAGPVAGFPYFVRVVSGVEYSLMISFGAIRRFQSNIPEVVSAESHAMAMKKTAQISYPPNPETPVVVEWIGRANPYTPRIDGRNIIYPENVAGFVQASYTYMFDRWMITGVWNAMKVMVIALGADGDPLGSLSLEFQQPTLSDSGSSGGTARDITLFWYDRDTDEPIENGRVYLKPEGKNQWIYLGTTGPEGEVNANNISPGTHDIKMFHSQYEATNTDSISSNDQITVGE